MVQYRKDLLVNNEFYHIYNRSIAKYVIFNNQQEYSRMLELIDVLRFRDFNFQLSQFKRTNLNDQKVFIKKLKAQNDTLTDIIAYCIMPTHFHLILKQNRDNGITKYMAKLLNSYSKYFNTLHQRSGPLWASRFKNVNIENDKQLLHLTRYIHLNPTSAKLINKPDNWDYSSYKEYLDKVHDRICNYKNVIKLDPKRYRIFVNDRVDYQQQLSQIKSSLIEEYAG